MDNTNIDFEYSIQQINRLVVDEYNDQSINLNSSDFNSNMNNMMNSLNTLYENTRYLEDAINYCDAFLNLKIKEYSQDIQELLKGIENVRDINKNSAYIEYLCQFKDDLSIKKDRDNSVISNTLIKENSLMLGIKNENKIDYSMITKQSNFVPYSNNLDNIKDEEYTSYYIEEKIANRGVIETLTITLNEPTELNYIDIKPINAEIKNLRLVYINGVEEYINYENGLIPTNIISQVKFDLVSKKYTTSKYYMDKTKLTDDVWNKIKEYEFKYAFDVDSKMELDEVIARVHEGTSEIYKNNISNKDNIIEKQMFNYLFGIESIELKNIKQETDSCFISESINIGQLKDKEYIQIHVEDVLDENAVVEYSLLDGNIEIPIMPYSSKIIKNEKLFSAKPLRFNQDATLAHTIKKDGMTVDISIEDAKQQLLNRFSIDYFPEIKYDYTPINSNVKIKAVIRSYNKEINNSYVRTIKIRKYGGDVLWTNM